MKAYWTCSRCGTNYSSRTGCGYTRRHRRVCYSCCAEIDARNMDRTGTAVLYLLMDVGLSPEGNVRYSNWRVQNWPGSLKIRAHASKGNHNISGVRWDVWFTFHGRQWHGVRYGRYTEICRCRRLKAA